MDRRIRFLLIGVANTIFCTGLYAVLVLSLGTKVPAAISVLVAWFISMMCAFIAYRRLVFQAHGHALQDFMRFAATNSVALLLNLGLIAFLVDALKFPAIPMQIGITCLVVIFSYAGHRHFSFRRKNNKEARGK